MPIQSAGSITNGKLLLSWPADHLGWRLRAHPGSAASGLGTDWATVSGSTATNRLYLSPGSGGSVFYRLVYP